MNPQDDPEARIRALEPTEFGSEGATSHGTHYGSPPPLPPPTQQWPDQTPYSQPQYGQSPYSAGPYGAEPYGTGYVSPYPSGPPVKGPGFRPWLAIVPIVLVFLALAGGAAVYFVFANTSTPNVPNIFGGGDVLTNEPAVPPVPTLPSLPSLPSLPTVVEGPASDSVPEPGTTVTITGIGANRSVICNDNVIIVSGANNTVDITGHCTAVTVSGFENVITAESTQEIAVSGFDNRVTYRTGTPQVSESGSGNSVTQG